MFMRSIALSLLMAVAPLNAEVREPTLTVTGRGVSVATPDQASVVFAVVAQATQAADAQRQVNKVMTEATAAVVKLGIAADALSTTGISLMPLYQDEEEPTSVEQKGPTIVGYQASNGLEVRLAQVSKVGPVIDAAVGAGANEVESVSFGLRDDRKLRGSALADAAQDARLHAEAIAKAMGLRLVAVEEVNEQGVDLYMPYMETRMKAMAAEVATPVQPGQARIEATVSVRYRISAEPAAKK